MKKASFVYLLIMLFSLDSAFAGNGLCVGKFVNPITDVCWSRVFPISIGKYRIKSGGGKRDTDNPSNIICWCKRKIAPVPLPGIAVGFWEPIRLVDITRTPMCLVNMGGIKLGSGRYRGTFTKKYDGDEYNQHSFYHTHLYVYPLIAWLKLVVDFGCLDKGETLDLAYMSEFDPKYKNDSNFLSPEAFLFANPIAKAACAADCIAANIHLPIDSLFWCAGCLGSLYPFSGHVATHVGGVQSASLLTARVLATLHRIGLSRKTMTTDSSVNGELCRNPFALKIVKSQYSLQMTYPIAASKGEFCSNPLGMSAAFYNSGREFPYKGEDFGFLIWRKKNCCFL